jgi:hypothetical protein
MTRVSHVSHKSSPLDAAFDPASIGLITGAKGGLPTIVVGGREPGAPTNEPRGRVSRPISWQTPWYGRGVPHLRRVDYRRRWSALTTSSPAEG